jgi:hypothetical protein
MTTGVEEIGISASSCDAIFAVVVWWGVSVSDEGNECFCKTLFLRFIGFSVCSFFLFNFRKMFSLFFRGKNVFFFIFLFIFSFEGGKMSYFCEFFILVRLIFMPCNKDVTLSLLY